jgi:hypothetical protein
MRWAIRAGIVVGLGLALAGVPGKGFAQDESLMATTPANREAAAKAEGPCEVSDPCEDINLGAASMEPEPDQAIQEDPGTKAHREWVESIWNTP